MASSTSRFAADSATPVAPSVTPPVPNIDRLNKVADMIEAHPEHFKQSLWYGGETIDYDSTIEASRLALEVDLFDCGTTGCIAGWACWLWAAEVDPDDDIRSNARQILGLATSVANKLFNGSNPHASTAEKAAGHLRRMAVNFERDQSGDAGAHDATRAEAGHDVSDAHRDHLMGLAIAAQKSRRT